MRWFRRPNSASSTAVSETPDSVMQLIREVVTEEVAKTPPRALPRSTSYRKGGKMVGTWLSIEEATMLESAAKAAGLSVSKYIKSVVMPVARRGAARAKDAT